MKPHMHLDPNKTTYYAAEKATIRTIICLVAAIEYPLRHLDLSPEFTAETYELDNPVLVHKMHRFDGTMKHKYMPHGRLILNLYGSKQTAHTYLKGLATHIKTRYTPTESDPFLFTKHTHNGTITTGITTNDFLVAAPHQHLITEFQSIIA